MTFKDYFSAHADAYSQYRPAYPDEVFDWLAGIAPSRARAWDCATGSGQAAVGLARLFERVIATDASARQLEQAAWRANIDYHVAPAEASGIAPASLDMVSVAQAVHWFELDDFVAEVRRVLKPDGVLAVWTYGLCAIAPDIDAMVRRFYADVLGPFWPPERVLVENGYEDLSFPWREIETPDFSMRTHWSLRRFLAYLATWSALRRYLRAGHTDPLPALHAQLAPVWGEAERTLHWPLALRAGRFPPE